MRELDSITNRHMLNFAPGDKMKCMLTDRGVISTQLPTKGFIVRTVKRIIERKVDKDTTFTYVEVVNKNKEVLRISPNAIIGGFNENFNRRVEGLIKKFGGSQQQEIEKPPKKEYKPYQQLISEATLKTVAAGVK